MKKLSLLLLTLCISLAGWAASLNPYAYDLKSTWDESTSTLNVQFKLNAMPNMNQYKDANNKPTNDIGIQIYAIDPSDNNRKYYIYGVSTAEVNTYKLDYNINIPITGVTWDEKEILPAGKNLTWGVTVQGVNKTNKGTPTAPVYVNQECRPFSCHGVAVNNNQNSPDFGAVYVTEAAKDDEVSGEWNWLKGKGKALLKYDPRMQSVVSYRKSPNFSDRNVNACLLEPHRVCVSEDGRVFVSSYNKNTRTDQIAVWEFKDGQFIPLIYHYPGDGIYGDRVCGMAVKGSGDNLRIMLCFIDEPNKYVSAFRMYEYNLNKLGANKNEGEWRGSYAPSGSTSDGSSASVQGAFTKAIQNKWYFYSDGLANVAYFGNGHVLAVDFFVGYGANAVLRYYEGTDKQSENAITASNKQGYYNGGAGLLAYQDGDDKYIVSGRTYYYGFETNANKDETNGRIHTYTLSGTTISSSPKSGWSLSGVKTRNTINAMAMDCANNIYAVSFTDGTNSVGTGQLLAFAMPYSGSVTTIAPSTNADANRYFNVKPVPNILATDLRCTPHETQNKYIFSFNTNTKPEEAQIRFYYSYEDMKNSLNVVNADNYDGTNNNKPAFVYNIPSGKLKQGEINVELGGVCGKLNANNEIINDSLPAGVLYWSVYVKTRESKAFAPIYEQSTTGEDTHNRLHATVNNYPETDGFGHIYAVNYYKDDDARNGLMEYNFNSSGNSNDEQNSIKNYNRYKLVKNYLNSTGSKPKFQNQRRLTVAPDGKVYIADCGSSQPFDKNSVRPWLFNNGGVYVWDPSRQSGDEIQITQFLLDKTESSTAVAIYDHGGQLKMYATNTYGEFSNHSIDKHYWKDKEYTEANQADVNVYGWNGFKEYNLGTPENILQQETNGTILRSLGMGDGNGNISLVATEKGIWLAQHRLNDVQFAIDEFNRTKNVQALPDNDENYILSFVPYSSNVRTWASCSGKGIEYKYTGSGSNKVYTGYEFKDDASELTQKTNSHLQSCPGAGLAYRKTNENEYLYIVNHQGNIVELQITSWSGTTPTVKYVKTYPGSGAKGTNDGGRTDGAISSMCFDYAGNLVTTSGADYLGSATQNILVYTMPYNRVNAREIQAPNSCRMIPERVAHLDMGARELDLVIQGHEGHAGCAIDLYRPLQGGMFNTICLPFELNLGSLPADHPLKDATLRAYTGLNLNTVGGEKVLELVFTDVNDKIIRANTPYIIRPQNDEGINHIIRFDGPLVLTNSTGNAITNTETTNTYRITYQGIVPFQLVQPNIVDGESLTLMLVANNRLAEMTTQGNMLGFRGYFKLNTPLRGMQTRITTQKPVATNTTIVVDGKKVNVEKFLREGRVYIRVGDTLYSTTGEKVE